MPTRHSTRMWEVVDTVRSQKCLGLVCGVPGVGKTLTGRRYVDWQKWERDYQGVLPETWLSRKAARYMGAHAAATPKTLIRELCRTLGQEVNLHARWAAVSRAWADVKANGVDSLIVDEADRLDDVGLEVLRDLYDRAGVSVIIMGTPKLVRRVERLPQLYSRIGFHYAYPPLTVGETADFIARAVTDWNDPQIGPRFRERQEQRKWTVEEGAAIEVVHRLTAGIPREIRRVMEQVDRIVRVNRAPRMTIEIALEAGKLLSLGKKGWPKPVFVPGLPKEPSPPEVQKVDVR